MGQLLLSLRSWQYGEHITGNNEKFHFDWFSWVIEDETESWVMVRFQRIKSYMQDTLKWGRTGGKPIKLCSGLGVMSGRTKVRDNGKQKGRVEWETLKKIVLMTWR